jgi:hypothetical protein
LELVAQRPSLFFGQAEVKSVEDKLDLVALLDHVWLDVFKEAADGVVLAQAVAKLLTFWWLLRV